MRNKLSATRNACTRLALLAIGLFFAVAAQADPAGRIGRIAWLSNADAVKLYNPESGESYNAPLNQPLTSGDVLTTAAGERAEIRIGSMTVRLDANSELTLDRIDDNQVHLYLNDGTAIVKLSARDTIDDFELTSPDGRFTARDTGIYRFDVDNNSSRATAYYGALNFADRDTTLTIDAGQSAQFGDTGRNPYRLSSAFSDDFSRWSADRDRRAPSTTYTRYVSPEMTGADDLDNYGDWSETPEYGAIWTPRRVDPDWVPYRTGHWVWVAPWGWNWVGNEPWGFAPFHYGRWVQHRGHWGWIPGTRVLRPVYSPAMVAWVGSPGLNVSISIGNRPNVGWFPLAPREVYVPSYHTSAVYIRNVNITHVTHITNVDRIVSNPQGAIQDMHYRHREMPRALTTVSADVITHRRPVESAMQPDSDRGDRGNRGDHRAPPTLTVAPQVARPVPTNDAPPRQERSRPERSDRDFPRRDGPRPEAARQDSPAPVAAPQRNDGPRPEIQRPMPPRPEVTETRGQAPAPAGAQVETRAPQVRQDQRPDQRLDRDSPRRDGRDSPNTEPPVTSGSPAPVVITPRGERPQPDIQRPIPPKPEVPESRGQAPAPLVRPEQAPPAPVATPPRTERPERAERPMPEVSRPAQRPAPTEVRVAPAPQQIQPPPPARAEAPASVRDPREPRRDGAREDKRPPVDEEELKRRRRQAEERK